MRVEVITEKSLYTTLLDLSDDQLNLIDSELGKRLGIDGIGLTISDSDVLHSPTDANKTRQKQELEYKKDFIDALLKQREKKYSIPVEGKLLPTTETKIPNSARPYRASYTDGIHHSWDINAPVGTPVIALDDAIVVRIVDSWDRGTLSNLRQ
jgi:murein DD-endopeptidase MepM/ murein hydrolase activator NlpD